MNERLILQSRVDRRKTRLGIIDVETYLVHFALINYALPKERLLSYIPELFEISISQNKLQGLCKR